MPRSASGSWTPRRVAVVALVALLSVSTLASAAHASLGADDCKSPTEFVGGRGVRIPAKHGTIWALPIGVTPASVGSPLKVVWRVTGSGRLRVHFESPDGKRVLEARRPCRKLGCRRVRRTWSAAQVHGPGSDNDHSTRAGVCLSLVARSYAYPLPCSR
jgi:hypothetical protein